MRILARLTPARNALLRLKKRQKPAELQPVKQDIEKPLEKMSPAITTIVYDIHNEDARSDSYNRDEFLASAKQTLLSMDHTKAIPH